MDEGSGSVTMSCVGGVGMDGTGVQKGNLGPETRGTVYDS